MSHPGDALLTAPKARAPVATARSNAGTPGRRSSSPARNEDGQYRPIEAQRQAPARSPPPGQCPAGPDRGPGSFKNPWSSAAPRAPASRAGGRRSAVFCGLALAGEQVEQLADGGLLDGPGQREAGLDLVAVAAAALVPGHVAGAGRLRVDGTAGSRVVRLGWFQTMPAGLLTATARAGRTDLLTVPPHTAEPAARAAMEQAAQAGNRTRTPALLAAITTAAIPGRPGGTPAGAAPDSTQLSTWEWDGGQDGTRSQRAATSAAI
jgi:Family of unknown function (DUF5994)